MKLSERIAYKPVENVSPMDLIEWAREAIQLEADLERHEGQIRHYPDSYLGKIFFRGVECGKKQLEARKDTKELSVASNDSPEK